MHSKHSIVEILSRTYSSEITLINNKIETVHSSEKYISYKWGGEYTEKRQDDMCRGGTGKAGIVTSNLIKTKTCQPDHNQSYTH
jgi:hypothetical protein